MQRPSLNPWMARQFWRVLRVKASVGAVNTRFAEWVIMGTVTRPPELVFLRVKVVSPPQPPSVHREAGVRSPQRGGYSGKAKGPCYLAIIVRTSPNRLAGTAIARRAALIRVRGRARGSHRRLIGDMRSMDR